MCVFVCVCVCVFYMLHSEDQQMHFICQVSTFFVKWGHFWWSSCFVWGLWPGFKMKVGIGFRLGGGYRLQDVLVWVKVRKRGMDYVSNGPHKVTSTRIDVCVVCLVWCVTEGAWLRWHFFKWVNDFSSRYFGWPDNVLDLTSLCRWGNHGNRGMWGVFF